MSATERWRRHRDRLRGSKPKAAPAVEEVDATLVLAQAKIAALERELAAATARIRQLEQDQAAPVQAERVASAAAPGGQRSREQKPSEGRPGFVGNLIRRLDASSSDSELLTAVSGLRNALQAMGADLHALADAWAVEEKKRLLPRRKPPPPIDFARLEEIVTRYAEGRTKLTLHGVYKPIHAEMPRLDGRYYDHTTLAGVHRCIFGCLQRLGFTASESQKTWQRGAATAAG
jgi:hypothetical protein